MKYEWVESKNYAPARAHYCYWLRAYVVLFPHSHHAWAVIKFDGEYLLEACGYVKLYGSSSSAILAAEKALLPWS